MKNQNTAPSPQPVRFERTYDGPADDHDAGLRSSLENLARCLGSGEGNH